MSKLDDILKRAMPQNALAAPTVKQELKALMLELIDAQPYQKQGSMHMIDANEFRRKVEEL